MFYLFLSFANKTILMIKLIMTSKHIGYIAKFLAGVLLHLKPTLMTARSASALSVCVNM